MLDLILKTNFSEIFHKILQGVFLTPKQPSLGKMTPKFHSVRFSAFIESKEINPKVSSYKTVGTINDIKKQTLSCYVNIKGWYDYSCKFG